jgi:hypothetical protein
MKYHPGLSIYWLIVKKPVLQFMRFVLFHQAGREQYSGKGESMSRGFGKVVSELHKQRGLNHEPYVEYQKSVPGSRPGFLKKIIGC